MTVLPDKAIEYDAVGAPKLTLKRTSGVFDLVVEIEGIAPYRSQTAEEHSFGIVLLDPPTVHAKNIDRLLSSGSRAVQTAVMATPDTNIGPGDLAMIHYRTTRAIRAALRLMGEDV